MERFSVKLVRKGGYQHTPVHVFAQYSEAAGSALLTRYIIIPPRFDNHL